MLDNSRSMLATTLLLAPLPGLRRLAPPDLSALASLSTRETGAGEVVAALFGSVSSQQAFSRQRRSITEVESKHAARETELTYGEFDLDFFFELLRAADPQRGDVFVDVGSGCGRLVLAAALVHEWEAAVGIELLRPLHDEAIMALARLREVAADDGGLEGLSLAPCELRCEEAACALPRVLRRDGPPAVVFIYATCWPSVGPHLAELSRTLGVLLPIGSRVIAVDKRLLPRDDATHVAGGECGWEFQLRAEVERPNYNTFRSVGYVYDLVHAAGDASAATGQVEY